MITNNIRFAKIFSKTNVCVGLDKDTLNDLLRLNLLDISALLKC